MGVEKGKDIGFSLIAGICPEPKARAAEHGEKAGVMTQHVWHRLIIN